MANHKWEGDTLTYDVPGAGSASIDVSAMLGMKLSEMPIPAQGAFKFGIQTAARNATAGLFKEEPATALKRIQARFAAWLKGEWKAASAGEGERKTSMLAAAVAEVGGITLEEAAEIISTTIESKVSEAGLDANDDDDKANIRKIGNAVRGAFEEADGVGVVLARMRSEAAQKRAVEAADAEAARKAEGKPTTKLADLLRKPQ
jgi:hypothetical protein